MKQCEKTRCIANVDGNCSVPNCKGELTIVCGKRHSKDAAEAAKFYEGMKEAFTHYFGNDYKDDDTEEF